MGDFKQGGNNRFGGHSGGFSGRGGRSNSFGKSWGGRGGNSDRGPVTMHKVICDECKKSCEVPFLPTAGKPVYCNTCFGGKKEMGGDDRRGGKFSSRGSADYKTPPRTDFGSDITKVSGEEIRKQIEVLNTKIDKLVKVIESLTPSKKENVEIKNIEEKAESVKTIKIPVKKSATPKIKIKKIIKKVSKK